MFCISVSALLKFFAPILSGGEVEVSEKPTVEVIR
jgi:hypothetical protein